MAADIPLQPTLWRTCRVLANPTRLQILQLLFKARGLSVSEVAKRLDLTLPVASQSLRALEARSFLQVHRRGRWVLYGPPGEGKTSAVTPLVSALRLMFQRKSGSAEHVFKLATAFTHPRRVEVFRALKLKARDFRALQKAMHVSSRALWRHLKKLEERGYVVHDGRLYSSIFPDTKSCTVRQALAELAAG